MGFLQDRKILVTGMLSNRSIAYGIAKAARREGAELAFTYQNERFKDRATDMAKELGRRQFCPARSPATPRSVHCLKTWASNGTASTGWCTPLPTRHGKRSPAISWRA